MPTAENYLRGTISDLLLNGGYSEIDKKVIEMFSQQNQILDDLMLVQCNNKTVHKSMVRTALPEVAWRMLNRGIQATKSGKKQESFTCGALEAHSEVDEKELVYGEPGSESNSQYRLDEGIAHQMAMNNQMATTLFYGDEKINPAGFTGLGAYYYSLDKAKCSASEYVIDAGGVGNNLTSMYFVVWSPTTIHGIFPEGTSAGFKYRDNGRINIQDLENKGSYWGYQAQYNWDLGLTVRDHRYAVRVANIDLTQPNEKFLDHMIEAYNRLQDIGTGKPALYTNRSGKTLLDKLAANKKNVMLNIETYHGKPTTQFWEIPVRRVDAILNTEQQVV